MLRIDDAHSIKLIAQTARIDLGAKICCIADYDSEDILIGGVLLMNDNGYSMEIHSAIFGANKVRRELLWAVFNYVFRVRRIKKLFGRVPESNIKARKLNRHLGFKEEIIIEDVLPGGEGLVVMSMYVEDCRFINLKSPEVKFASIEKTNIAKIYEYSQGKIGT